MGNGALTPPRSIAQRTSISLCKGGVTVSTSYLQGCGCKSNIASVMQEMGITIMLAGNIGMGAYNKLTAHGIRAVRGCHGNIEEVLKAYLDGSIADSAESCSHHDCSEHKDKHVFIIPNKMDKAHRPTIRFSGIL